MAILQAMDVTQDYFYRRELEAHKQAAITEQFRKSRLLSRPYKLPITRPRVAQ